MNKDKTKPSTIKFNITYHLKSDFSPIIESFEPQSTFQVILIPQKDWF